MNTVLIESSIAIPDALNGLAKRLEMVFDAVWKLGIPTAWKTVRTSLARLSDYGT